MQPFLRKNTSTYLLAIAFGGLFGSLILSYCQDGNCPALINIPDPNYNQGYHDLMVLKPEYYIWFFLLIFVTALAFLLAFPLWSSLRQFKPYLTKRKIIDLAVSTIILLLLFLLPDGVIGNAIKGQSLPLYLFFSRVTIIEVLTNLCIFPALFGIWLIRDGIETEYKGLKTVENENQVVQFMAKHAQYRTLSQIYLLVMGVIITLATLTTGANRNLGILIGMNENRLTSTVVLTYGLYFSVVVGLIYVPTYLALLHTGSDLCDRLFPVQTIDKLGEVTAKRKEFEQYLKLNINTEQSLRTGLIILSPLLTGVFSALLGSK